MTSPTGNPKSPGTSAAPGPDMGEDDETVVVVRRPRAPASRSIPEGPASQSIPDVAASASTDADVRSLSDAAHAADVADDLTIVVARRAKATRSPAEPSAATPATPKAPPTPRTPTPRTPTSRTPRRRGITPPPGPHVVAPQAIVSVGTAATENYPARVEPAPPPLRAPLHVAAAATRDASVPLPSVAKHSRITARAALLAFGLACAVSVVGLTLLALAYLRTH